MSISAADYRARQTEAEFAKTVRDAARVYGWLVVSFPQMLANPSGFPDFLLFRDGRLIIAELKTERGRLGPRQREWCARLFDAGFPVRIWTPADWPSIEAALKRGEPA